MKKKWLTVLIICMALMFAWIFLAVALTGGRDPVDFTQRDKQVMIAFTVVEVLTVAVMLVAACLLGRQAGRSMPKIEPVSLTKAEKARKRMGAVLMWAPLLLAFAAQIGGILLRKGNDAWVTGGAKWLCGLGYLLCLVVLPLVSVLAVVLQKKHFEKMSVSEANAFVLSHREQAEQTAERKLGQLRFIRLASNVYGLFLFLLGLFLAVLSGYLYQSDTSVPRVFGAECGRAIDFLDARMEADMGAYYADFRREKYVEPLERVTAWEASGCPLTAEGYADIVEDLRLLCRESDAIALCDRAIEALSPAAAGSAYFIRGIHRLHCYDRAGLEDLYTAIAGNSNYIDEAMDQIGSFCCLMGLEQELEEYRGKALELAQRQKDEFSALDTLTRRDNLSQEHLPEGMLEAILAYICSISQDSIEKIFLVRKTISDQFFTSAFVIRFLPGTPEDTRQQVLHKIFRYLDTSTDWQFSLFDEAEIPKGLTDRVENSCVFEKK